VVEDLKKGQSEELEKLKRLW